MSIFGSLFGKQPATPNPPSPIRETLFGDMPLDQWPPSGAASEELPWGAFVAARQQLAAGNPAEAIAGWRRILAHRELEPRCHLQAWHFLRQHGQVPPPDVAKQLWGVVVEVGMPQGLDLLAAYPDYSARYYNFSGAGVVWEHPDDSLNAPIDQLLQASREVVMKIGPWDKARPQPPANGHVRISFLTPSGLHFGQGPMTVLSRDPMGGLVIQLATNLMQGLIGKTKPA